MPSSSRTFRSSPERQPYDSIAAQGRLHSYLPTSPLDSANRSSYDDEEAVELLKSGLRLPTVSVSDIDLEEEHQSGLFRTRWSWLRRALAPVRSGWKSEGACQLLPSDESPLGRAQKPSIRSGRLRCLLYSLIAFFTMLGIIQFLILACGVVVSFFPDQVERTIDRWGQSGQRTEGLEHWPTDSTRDIVPVGCHSHNDYWRSIPLFSALQAGCIGVEADVWLVEDELYVGHTTSSLAPNRTLKNLYINPLVDILEKQNPVTRFHPEKDHPQHGVFDTDPSQTLVLLIDLKTDGPTTWPHVVSQLSSLRDRGYLTYFDGKEVVKGPVTVVGTGNTPFDLLTANATYRDIFFDAPLAKLAEEWSSDIEMDSLPVQKMTPPKRSSDSLGQGHSGMPIEIGPDTFNPTNSYYASVSFKKSIGIPWHFHITPKQMERIRAQINGAHRRGLKVRYWGLPNWPRSLRNHIWNVLVREGVDILNVDDLASATRKDWGRKPFGWWIY